MDIVVPLISILWAWAFGVLAGIKLEQRNHNASHEEFALEVVKRARKLASTRRLVGDGVTITNEQQWSLGELGSFKFTLEQLESAQSNNTGEG